MECPVCQGRGCRHCDHGTVRITACPLTLLPSEIWTVLDLAALYDKGLPPVAGGALDQAEGFLAACRFIQTSRPGSN